MRLSLRVALATMVLAFPAVAQDTVRTQRPAPEAVVTLPPARVPFAVGERLDYEVKYKFLRVGSGSMEVASIDTIRGIPAWHTVFRIHGGPVFYRVDDRFESWIAQHSLSSLRFWQDQNEGRRDVERRYEIFPDRAVFLEEGKTEQPSVSEPLDDGSFLYYLRTLPLEVGKEYHLDKYFRPDRNPVTIRVLRKEKIRVPAGTFDAIVVQPIIKAKGVFSEGGRAEVWLSDDENHIMLQMKSQLSIGSLNLYLKSYHPAPPRAAADTGKPANRDTAR
jgi:Protein of unknown function (DUF3108)